VLARLAAAVGVNTVGAGAVLSTEHAGGSDLGELAVLINYGVLGIVTLLWLLGRIETPKRADQAEARALAAEQRERDLNATLRTDVVPALVQFTAAATRILDRDAGR
jgi:hypothetical protein